MFEGIKRRVQDFRINADFPRFDQLALAKHLAEANWRFDDSKLRLQIETIKRQATEAAKQKFSASTESLEREIEFLAPRLRLLREQLSILTRDYKSEIDELYVKKDCINAEDRVLAQSMQDLQLDRSASQDELRQAHVHLASIKNAISNWHDKSERSRWLLGNQGKKLPQHAMFGQSLGDLDKMKADRSHAARVINDCKKQIDDIESKKKGLWDQRQQNKALVAVLFAQLDSVKLSRGAMFQLREQGHHPSKMQADIAQVSAVDVDLRSRLSRLESEFQQFLSSMEQDLGIREHRTTIDAMGTKKGFFVSNFKSDESRVARRAEHREIWLKDHS